jgi:deazaflavin-dependent oxidoreductase (nitroreductase family)
MTTNEARDRRIWSANSWITRLLRSPLHSLISGNTMLITVTGKQTGKRYTVPVNYARDGDSLIVRSRAGRTWWRNLRGGAPVELRLRGRDLEGHADIIEGAAAVSNELQLLLRRAPALAGRLHVTSVAAGLPKHSEQLTRFAEQNVLVRIGELAPLEHAGRAQEVGHG